MNKELLVQVGAVELPVAQPASWMKSVGIALAGSALVAVCAHVALPLYFTPVPLTLAPFAVLLIGLALSPRMAAATLGAYLVEGAAGLPVFAPSTLFLSGVAHLVGPTGGYLLAYPLTAALISGLWHRSGKSFSAALWSVAAGDLLLLTLGALWLAALTHASLQSTLSLAVLPFLPGEVLKVAAAAALAAGYERRRRRAL